jgi:hypothetical protein
MQWGGSELIPPARHAVKQVPMRTIATLPTRCLRSHPLQCVMLSTGLLLATLLAGTPGSAQTPAAATQAVPAHPHTVKPRTHKAKKQQQPAPPPVAEAPPPPPMPRWPVNDKPNPASVVWDATGLRINASNSSLQQILNEVSTETGAKIEGSVPDQRIYGEYGPGQARDVLTQLLQGSGYNILLAGDLGMGAPRQIVLSPRRTGTAPANNAAVDRAQQDQDDEVPEQPEEPPPPVVQTPIPNRPGFGPNGPVRTPQQVMEEMQQRQQQQQQQQQQDSVPQPPQ